MVRTRPTRVRGFTLIELVVVIAIISILMGIVLAAYASHLRQAREIRAMSRVADVCAAVRQFRMDHGTFPWSAPAKHDPIDRNRVALELLPLNAKVNPGLARACVYNTAQKNYLTVKDEWLKDFDGDGNMEIIDPWGYPLKFRVDPREPDRPVVWSLGDPKKDARLKAGAALAADRSALSIGDETADCPDGERAACGYGVENGMDLTDAVAFPSTYYCFKKGGKGNDVTDPATTGRRAGP